MKRFRAILSATLAFLVLFSSSSFMVGLHLCGGQVQNVALFGKADVCAMEKQVPPCHKHQAKPCCEDETIVHKGDDFKVSTTHISFAAPVADLVAPAIVIAEIIPAAPAARIRYHHYDPPVRTADLTVSLQVFLI